MLPFPSAQAGCMKGYLKPLRKDPDIFVWCIGILMLTYNLNGLRSRINRHFISMESL